MRDEEKHDWDRQPGESSKAYAHFCLYRDMSVNRSLRQMEKLDGCTSQLRQLMRWSSKWRWVERCQLYDDYNERQLRVQQEKERREMHKRHAKIAMLGQNILIKGMEELLAKVQNGQQNLAPTELARLMDVSVKIERLARGESTDIQESVGPGGGPVQLSIQNVADKAREAIEESLGIADRSAAERTEADSETDLPPVPDPLGDGHEPTGAGG
jgi:hypothetical protein